MKRRHQVKILMYLSHRGLLYKMIRGTELKGNTEKKYTNHTTAAIEYGKCIKPKRTDVGSKIYHTKEELKCDE